MWCWGHNNRGQLGDNTTTDISYPVQVVGSGGTGTLSSVYLVGSSEGSHFCAARTDRTAWCWGLNNKGQLGDNTTNDSRFPVQAGL